MPDLPRENSMCCYDRNDYSQEEITTLECDEIFKIGTFRTNVGAIPDLRGKMNERQGRRHLCERKMQKSAAFQLEGKCNKATMKDQDESLKAFNQAGKKQLPR